MEEHSKVTITLRKIRNLMKGAATKIRNMKTCMDQGIKDQEAKEDLEEEPSEEAATNAVKKVISPMSVLMKRRNQEEGLKFIIG